MANKLFILPKQQFKITALDQALDNIIHSQSGNDLKNIVIFIHGRGAGKVKHPQKSIKQQLPFIESEYDARVILFNWDGSGDGGPLGFPQKEARAAANDLFKLLTQLQKYKEKYSDQLNDVRFTLLTHSMGSIVVEETLLQHSDKIKPDVLDVLLLSSSASKAKKHSKWLNKASLASNVLVTLNSEDGGLGFGGILRGRRLGKGLKNKETSVRANYVDLSNTGVGHRYFIAHTESGTQNGQKKNPCIKAFYKAALNGVPVDLETFPGIKKIKNKRVFVMKTQSGVKCR